MKSDLEFILAIFIGLVLFVFVVASVFYLTETAKCNELKMLNPDYEFQFKWGNGCMMKSSSGLWLPVGNITVTENG
jgi:hypothetical protein